MCQSLSRSASVALAVVSILLLVLCALYAVPGAWNDYHRGVLNPVSAPEPPLRGFQLTPEQIATYHRDGFVVIPNVYTTEEISHLETRLEEQLDNFGFTDVLTSCARKLHGEFFRNTWTWRFWQGGPVGDIAQQLLGSPAKMITSEILEMKQNRPCIPGWHWDYVAFPMNSHGSDGVQAWLATSHVNSTNGGGIEFVNASHTMSFDDPCNPYDVFHKSFALEKDCYQTFERRKITVDMRPGDIVMFSRYAIHRSVPLYRAGSRLGFTIRIARSDAIFKAQTMNCYPNHPVGMYGGIQDGQTYGESSMFPLMTPGRTLSKEDIVATQWGLRVPGFFKLALQGLIRPGYCRLMKATGVNLNKPSKDVTSTKVNHDAVKMHAVKKYISDSAGRKPNVSHTSGSSPFASSTNGYCHLMQAPGATA